MGFGGAMLALSAVQAVNSIGSGYAKSAEDKYNATLSGLQSQLIGVQGDITQGQMTRQGGQYAATQTATAAAAGVEPTGSIAAVMLDTQTQIHTDMAIAKFNTEMGQNYKNAEAAAMKRKASQDVYSGYSDAFSEMLSGAAAYGKYSLKPKSFDLNAGAEGVMG